MTFSSWKLRDSTLPPDRIYERPLGLTELSFYYDCLFNGTADTLQHVIVETLKPCGKHLFGEKNVSRTWIALKQQFPLLGSQLEGAGDQGDGAVFAVSERRLQMCSPGELTFRTISSPKDAQDVVDNILKGEWPLSDDQLGRVFILSLEDQSNHFHVILHVAHAITDGISNTTILRTFLDTLSSTSIPPTPNLEERLAMASASEELEPGLRSNMAKRRWRRAIGRVLSNIQLANMEGGHTLPRNVTPLTNYTPAQSCRAVSSFSLETSKSIIANCRKNQLTFGNAFPVLGQLGLTRVLCRRYIRGDISHEEWEYRKRQPMYNAGPLNLRPFLDRNWLSKGGATTVCLSIGFFRYTLPFMPLGSASALTIGNDLPSFDALLSRKRFLLRCNMVKKQAMSIIKHPLFFDITAARSPGMVERKKEVLMKWRQLQDGEELGGLRKPATAQPVGHGGSSFGNVDALIPRDYPLPSVDRLSPSPDNPPPTPLIHVHSTSTHLHCRPAELYLGAATSRDQLHLSVFWDGNVYDENIVKEWLEEVRNAASWYLGHEAGDPPQAKL